MDFEVHGQDFDTYIEEGTNGMALERGSAKKQKWLKKKTSHSPYKFFDKKTEMKKDDFLDTVSREERDKWWPDLKNQQWKNKSAAGVDGEDGNWYFIYSGKHTGLYKDYTDFEAKRDEDYYGTVQGLSKKATLFNSLEEAKVWLQASRDEEGAWWLWPTPMPIFYN